MAAPLPAGYYLDNFLVLLDHVEHRYLDLLDEPERDFIRRFRSVSTDAARLYVRLACRKGPLFRADKLRYPEIIDVEAAAAEAAAAGLMDDAPGAPLEMVLALLVKGEIHGLLDGAVAASERREVMVCHAHTTLTAAQVRARMPLAILRPLGGDVLEILKLLFFGNPDQALTEFVLDELGVTPYERYPLDANFRLFANRSELDDALALFEVRALCHELIAQLDAAELVLLADSVKNQRAPQLQRRAGHVLNRIARQLERLGELDQALAIYERSSVPPARERRARVHDRLGDTRAALELCAEISADPLDEAEYRFAARFFERLTRRCQSARLPARRGSAQVVSHVAVTLPPAECRVEEAARQWYEAQGHDACYVENSLFNGVFGLAFWDIIFHPLPGVFAHPFQRGPMDLFSGGFRQRRGSLIDARLKELDDAAALKERVVQTHVLKCPNANHFVHWGRLTPELAAKSVERIPPPHFRPVFERLLRDPRGNASGFPDLVVFTKAGGYELIEVKGPGDSLQNNQRMWLEHFAAYRIPARVLEVTWA